jgi:CDP-diacylglycerol--glycerol-3-phosphate 3-phosphatidyltransferase
MLNRFARALVTRLLTPRPAPCWPSASARRVTLVGTLGVAFGASPSTPRVLLLGTVVITAFVFSDTVDGIMARLPGGLDVGRVPRLHARPVRGRRGLQRLVLYYATTQERWATAFVGLALACLVLGQMVSYAGPGRGARA